MNVSKGKSHRSIKASVVSMSVDDFKDQLKEFFTNEDEYHDILEEVVNAAASYDDYFSDEQFWDIDEFCSVNFSNEDDPLEIVRRFWFGKDWSYSRGTENNGANPLCTYARYDAYGNIETCEYPGYVYFETMLDSVIGYIVDERDGDIEFPEEIQELIDNYNGFGSDTESWGAPIDEDEEEE